MATRFKLVVARPFRHASVLLARLDIFKTLPSVLGCRPLSVRCSMPAYKHPFPKLANPSVLSPMAGVTDVAFRTLCKRYGAGLTVTEFTSAAAIVRASHRTDRMLQTDPSETPVAVQLFGGSEEEVVAAACRVQSRFDIIDINCGCPAWKVVRCGAGSAMLTDESKVHRFVAGLVDATSRPVTVKIRIGIDDKRINALSVAKLVEEAGASAIAVHGRTQAQGYRGIADWSVIKQVKESVGIPVIGNGDVFSPETFSRRLEESGVDAIMVARGAIGKPWLFGQITEHLRTGQYRVLTNSEQVDTFFSYVDIAQAYDIPFAQVKTHAQAFTTGQTGAGKLRAQLVGIKSMEELLHAMRAYRALVAANERTT
jgi:nifR3 family TIM-barrel protein